MLFRWLRCIIRLLSVSSTSSREITSIHFLSFFVAYCRYGCPHPTSGEECRKITKMYRSPVPPFCIVIYTRTALRAICEGFSGRRITYTALCCVQRRRIDSVRTGFRSERSAFRFDRSRLRGLYIGARALSSLIFRPFFFAPFSRSLF
jgi:hypothetical protein